VATATAAAMSAISLPFHAVLVVQKCAGAETRQIAVPKPIFETMGNGTEGSAPDRVSPATDGKADT
jgi:hypothetical protein